MAVSVVMPALEMAQETGKLIAWLKKEGETVSKGEMLLEVETDKAVVEIEALGNGILAGITAKEGDVIPVGQTIAWLVQAGEEAPAVTSPTQTGRTMDATAATAVAGPAVSPSINAGAPMTRLSPRARKLAQQHGIDVSTLRGSGPGGEILAEDILKAADASVPAVASGGVETVSSIGRIMAERTTASWTTTPHFFVVREIDATALNAARQALMPEVERSHAVKLTHTDLLVSAVARTLRRHPRMNGSWTADGIALNPDINVALAMAVDQAVVTAVIRNADRLSLGEIAASRKALAERARANRLQPADISGATFTISNLGMFGVDAFTAIIVPPQAGILAVGVIADRVVALSGQVVIRPTLTLTLSSDHRVVDGAAAAVFLNDVADLLRQPDSWS